MQIISAMFTLMFIFALLKEKNPHTLILGNHKDATFMHMKNNHMNNGHLKPAYNLQTITEKQFITHFDFFPNSTNFHTFIPFNTSFKERYSNMPSKEVADSCYGSEENYKFMQKNEIEAFVSGIPKR